MTDKRSSTKGIGGMDISQTLIILGLVLMLFGFFTANAAFLGIGVVFFVFGLAQRNKKPQRARTPFAEIQIDLSTNYNLFMGDSDTFLGEISGKQLQFLVDNLEEEFLEDHDYAITKLTIDYLGAKGVDPDLTALLNQALGEREEITIIWKRA